MSTRGRAPSPIANFGDAERCTRAAGEFCAKNCRDFDAENLKNDAANAKQRLQAMVVRMWRRIAQPALLPGLADAVQGLCRGFLASGSVIVAQISIRDIQNRSLVPRCSNSASKFWTFAKIRSDCSL